MSTGTLGETNLLGGEGTRVVFLQVIWPMFGRNIKTGGHRPPLQVELSSSAASVPSMASEMHTFFVSLISYEANVDVVEKELLGVGQ